MGEKVVEKERSIWEKKGNMKNSKCLQESCSKELVK